MSNPASVPAVPAQPNLEVYSIQALGLFQTFTRDTYQSSFGVQAPAWDPARLRKTWFDSTVDTSDAANVVVYKIVARDATGNGILKQMVISTEESATVNLPGAVTYPPYIVAPTNATRGGAPINASYLSLESDARALMAIIGGTALGDEGATAIYPVIYPPDEPRRMWGILIGGQSFNVGALLALRNANGAGSPGSWDTSSGGPVWTPAPPAPTGVDDMRPPRDMPVRDLRPNEKLQAGMMGVSVVRTDLQQAADEQGGQFTPDDRAALQRVLQLVAQLAGKSAGN